MYPDGANSTNPDARSEVRYDYDLKCIVIGPPNSGKSSLIMRLTEDYFTDSHISSIGTEFKVKVLNADKMLSKLVRFRVWDTCIGKPSQVNYKHAIIITIDMSKDIAREVIDPHLLEINRYCMGTPTVILIGTKADLCTQQEYAIKEVALKMLAENLMKERPYVTCIATSSKSGSNVNEAFEKMGKLTIEQLQEIQLRHAEHVKQQQLATIYKTTLLTYLDGQLTRQDLKNSPIHIQLTAIKNSLITNTSLDTLDSLKTIIKTIREIVSQQKPAADSSGFFAILKRTVPTCLTALNELFDSENNLKPNAQLLVGKTM